jgi:outer membrane protein TolC
MKRYVFIITILFFAADAQSQPLSLDEFLAVVKSHHPIAKQAAISVDIAKAEATAARGGFDPLFTNEISRKEFGSLLYYDQQISELKIPTWYGIDVVAGVESLTGARTSTPDTKGNSSYVGFSVPIAKGLLIDKRRAALQQAKIFQNLSVQDQRTVLNDLLYEAAKAYTNWWQQHQVQSLFQQAIKNAEQRFKMVKTAYQLGDRPAIDTIEALVQLQSFQLRQTEISLEIANSQLEVTVFLWQKNGEAYSLPPTVVPQRPFTTIENFQIENLLQSAQQHPELQQYRFKLEALNVEKRLKFQSLLPSVYLKYNQLNKSHDLVKSFSTPWLQNNYRYGVAIAIPLRLSEGRGEYRKARLKIEQTELAKLNKQVTLQTKLQQYYNEWKNLQGQMALQLKAIASYAALQRGEEVRFLNGESSLFLVNAREIKTLEAQQKLIELQSKEGKAAASTLWAAGTLVNVPR